MSSSSPPIGPKLTQPPVVINTGIQPPKPIEELASVETSETSVEKSMQPIPEKIFYNTVNLQFTFTADATDTIKAKTSNTSNYTPVEIPKYSCLDSSALSPLDKIKRLVNSCLLRPVTQGQMIRFEPLPPENITWPLAGKLPLPSSETKWISRFDSTISYITGNVVVSWDWIRDRPKQKTYQTLLTALAEMPDGSLIVGDNKGSLHFGSENHSIGPGTISEISPISSTLILVKLGDPSKKKFSFVVCGLTKNTSTLSVDVSLKLTDTLKDCEEVFVLGKDKIVLLKSTEVFLYQYCDASKSLELRSKQADVSIIYPIKNSNTHLLLFNTGKKTLRVWDTNTEKITEIDQHSYENFFGVTKVSSNIFLLEEKLACVFGSSNSVGFYNISSKKITYPHKLTHNVKNILLLSNSSILVTTDATSPNPNYIYHIDKEEQRIYSKLDPNGAPAQNGSLIELVNGSVVGLFDKSLIVMKPSFSEPKDQNYTIPSLKSSLNLNPYKLDLYFELAKLCKNVDEQKQIYLAGLEAARRDGNDYQARRFDNVINKTERTSNAISLKENNSNPNSPNNIHFASQSLRKEFSLENAKKYKQRLLIGEGTFTYTQALIAKHEKKHPLLAHFITATELNTEIKINGKKTSLENHEICLDLINKGVTVMFGIDGEYIHKTFKGRRFERIQWNCPFHEASPEQKEKFKKVIPTFFLSASKLQLVGDRIHVTLMQEPGDEKCNWKTRQIENPIVKAATKAHYRLRRKRFFGPARYTKYVHAKTNGDPHHSPTEEMREFVFEKTDKAPSTLEFLERLEDSKIKKYTITTDKKNSQDLKDYYFECSTDEDSSDYESD